MKLFLVRHGQTDWNLTRHFQGQSDVPLNETGRQQATALVKRLSNQSFEAIYSSDLQRAVETVKICRSDWQSNLRQDPRLREVNFGDWEGLTYNEIKEKYPDSLATWERDVYSSSPLNGETLEDLAKRAQSFLDDLLQKHNDQTVLVVAHGGVLQVMVCLALKLSPKMYWQFYLSTASLSQISFYPAGAILNLLNDTSHLEKE
jgi:alpha-ribazole phosphatase/probable phosphoglycerate mutase